MKAFLLIFSIAIAIASFLYTDTLTSALQSLKQRVYTTTTATTSQPNPHFYNPSNTETMTSTIPRTIRRAILATQQSEGAGAKVRRSIGTSQLRHLSPFLMLDHFTIPPSAGFPDHPHRGQETITYLLSGSVDHEDFAGNKGTIYPGDLQFMTAGRGIVHAEMPGQGGPDKIEGMQLWVDLPEHLKMVEPRYRDLRAKEIPSVTCDDGKVEIKIISGKSHGVDSVKDLAYTPVWILDIKIQPGGSVTQEVPAKWNTFAYTLEGKTQFTNGVKQDEVAEFHNVVFNTEGDSVSASVKADAEKPGRFFLVSGQPLDQKIVQYGPFVLSSEEGVYQALSDYQTRSNGFERANNWQSEIGKRMM